MNRYFVVGPVGAIMFLLAQAAEARTIDGWLGECQVTGTGACTEPATPGYARQPISFSTLGAGLTVNAQPYTFGQGVTGTIAGRAVYDAPTGGRLLLVLPSAAPIAIPSQGDRGDVGALRFTLAPLAGYSRVDAFSGSFALGSILGNTPDGSTVTAGTNETITRGVLAANPGSIDALPLQVAETTGFNLQIPASTTTVDVQGAGTLSTGTVLLPLIPTSGQIERLLCDVTVTTLTLSPGTGTTLIGSAPTSCGPNASHEFQYLGANATWHVLF